MSFTSFMFRTMAKKADDKKNEGLRTPEDVTRFDDICYGESRKSQVLDVYKPKDIRDKVLPVIINVHGGGWVYGDKELYQFYCISLAQKGFAVINFTYRLAPRHKHPAQLEDLNQVVCWMYNNSKQYGFDLNNVFFVGDSAGAHLSAIYSCACTNRGYEDTFTTIQIPKNFIPSAIALNCGIYKVERCKKRGELTTTLMKDLLGKNAEAKYEQLSPILHLTDQFPPTYLMSARGDFLLAQAPDMLKALQAKGVFVQYKIYGTEEKPLTHVFHCDLREEAALRCNEEECQFFRTFIK